MLKATAETISANAKSFSVIAPRIPAADRGLRLPHFAQHLSALQRSQWLRRLVGTPNGGDAVLLLDSPVREDGLMISLISRKRLLSSTRHCFLRFRVSNKDLIASICVIVLCDRILLIAFNMFDRRNPDLLSQPC
jgi:hypothetical protein